MNRFIFIFSILFFSVILSGCSTDNEDEKIEEIEGLVWQEINSDCLQVTVTSVDDYVHATLKSLVEDAAYVDYITIKFKKKLPRHITWLSMLLSNKKTAFPRKSKERLFFICLPSPPNRLRCRLFCCRFLNFPLSPFLRG